MSKISDGYTPQARLDYNRSMYKPNVDADYLEYIKKYQGSPYYQQMVNNPWLFASNAEFSPNFLQSFAETVFSDTSAEDAYYADLVSKRNQYLSDLIAQTTQTAYNSPSNQANLERQAGLNPDLTGVSGVGAAAENDQPIQPLEMSHESAMNDVISIGSTIVNTALSFYTGLQNIKGVQLENAVKEFALNSRMKDFAWDIIREGTGQFLSNGLSYNPNSPMTIEAISENGAFIEPIVKSFQNRVRNMNFSKRQRQALNNIFDDLVFAKDDEGTKAFSARYQSLVNDLMSDMYDSRDRFAKSSNKPYVENESQLALRFISSEIYKPLQDLQNRVLQAQLGASRNKALFESSYYSHLSAEDKAKAENEQYKLRGDMGNIKNDVLEAFKQINKAITGSRELSPVWKIALQSGVASAEVLLMNKLAF